jgi:hypothetical protein
VKHLSPLRLAALADGLPAAGPESAHLRACAACRAELAALGGMAAGLRELPALPKGLRQATLRSLGLSQPAPKASWSSPWLWGPALAAGLACALVLPRFRPAAPAAAAATATPPGPRPLARPLPRCPAAADAAPATAARTAPSAPPAPAAGGSLATQAQAPAPAAVGAQPAEPVAATPLDVRGDEPGPKATPPADGLAITDVRNNLLKGGGRFSLVARLAQAGVLNAVVLDSQGRTVATLYHGSAGPGDLALDWNGAAPSGAYTVLLQTNGASQRVHVLVVH